MDLNNSFKIIKNDWKDIFLYNFYGDIGKINSILKNFKYNIYPPEDDVFNAFKYTSLDNTKVVLLGQDPYHGQNQANGLSFCVNNDIKTPSSLQNIFKELASEYNIENNFKNELLKSWANQGVLLLNSTLTVIEKQANSMSEIGWQLFTDKIIKYISDNKQNVVFLLWGNYAQSKKHLIDNNKHLILETSHPSGFSCHKGFFGSNHFIKTNEYLKEKNLQTINWIK